MSKRDVHLGWRFTPQWKVVVTTAVGMAVMGKVAFAAILDPLNTRRTHSFGGLIPPLVYGSVEPTTFRKSSPMNCQR